MDGLPGTTVTTIIFLLAAITDWLDGYIARKVCLYLFAFELGWAILLASA